jgi:hypothetical protein
MPAKDKVNQSLFCNETSLAEQGINCRQEFCQCTHTLQVPLMSLVEVILVDEGFAYDANHPLHLHGMPFRVVGMERLNTNVTVEGVSRNIYTNNLAMANSWSRGRMWSSFMRLFYFLKNSQNSRNINKIIEIILKFGLNKSILYECGP